VQTLKISGVDRVGHGSDGNAGHDALLTDVSERRVDGALSGVEAPWLLHSVSATDCPLWSDLAVQT
jgi:hypothetical protein